MKLLNYTSFLLISFFVCTMEESESDFSKRFSNMKISFDNMVLHRARLEKNMDIIIAYSKNIEETKRHDKSNIEKKMSRYIENVEKKMPEDIKEIQGKRSNDIKKRKNEYIQKSNAYKVVKAIRDSCIKVLAENLCMDMAYTDFKYIRSCIEHDYEDQELEKELALFDVPVANLDRLLNKDKKLNYENFGPISLNKSLMFFDSEYTEYFFSTINNYNNSSPDIKKCIKKIRTLLLKINQQFDITTDQCEDEWDLVLSDDSLSFSLNTRIKKSKSFTSSATSKSDKSIHKNYKSDAHKKVEELQISIGGSRFTQSAEGVQSHKINYLEHLPFRVSQDQIKRNDDYGQDKKNKKDKNKKDKDKSRKKPAKDVINPFSTKSKTNLAKLKQETGGKTNSKKGKTQKADGVLTSRPLVDQNAKERRKKLTRTQSVQYATKNEKNKKDGQIKIFKPIRVGTKTPKKGSVSIKSMINSNPNQDLLASINQGIKRRKLGEAKDSITETDDETY